MLCSKLGYASFKDCIRNNKPVMGHDTAIKEHCTKKTAARYVEKSYASFNGCAESSTMSCPPFHFELSGPPTRQFCLPTNQILDMLFSALYCSELIESHVLLYDTDLESIR
jgi:hypothetical protein